MDVSNLQYFLFQEQLEDKSRLTENLEKQLSQRYVDLVSGSLLSWSYSPQFWMSYHR